MYTTANTYRYSAFGLRVDSDLPLPELRTDGTEAEAEVCIRLCDLSRDWSRLPEKSHLQVRDGTVYYLIPGVAIYRVRNGREIAVSPFANADPGSVRLYLLGSCVGALLLQRRMLPLHGSALEIDGNACAIVGHSGAGKSTLAALLAARGFRLISDDVAPVLALKGEEAPCVVPSYPQQKLWRETLRHLGMDEGGFRELCGRMDKFAVPAADSFSERPVPLKFIFELVRIPGGGETAVKAVEGLAKFPVILSHTYRNYLIHALNLKEWHFSEAARIGGAARVYRLYRPEGRFTAEELASLLLSIVREGG